MKWRSVFLLVLTGMLIGVLVGVLPHWHADLPLSALETRYAQAPSQWLDLDMEPHSPEGTGTGASGESVSEGGAAKASRNTSRNTSPGTSRNANFEGSTLYRIHYRDEGQGPPLLLLHGTAANLHTWQAWTDTLKGRFRCIRLDLPGFGLTGPHPDADYRIEAYLDIIDRFVQTLGLDSVAIAGNSLGGEIAWRYALHHPERARRLVLIDPAGIPHDRPPSLGFRLAQSPVLGGLMSRLTPKPLLRRSLEEVYTMDELVTDSLVDLYFFSLLREGNRQAFIDRARTPRVDHSHRLEALECPTLIVWGQDDAWIPVELGYIFERRIPDAELLVFPGAGHVPQEEIPILTATTVERYLCASGW